MGFTHWLRDGMRQAAKSDAARLGAVKQVCAVTWAQVLKTVRNLIMWMRKGLGDSGGDTWEVAPMFGGFMGGGKFIGKPFTDGWNTWGVLDSTASCSCSTY